MFKNKDTYWLLVYPPTKASADIAAEVQVFESVSHAFRQIGGGPDLRAIRCGIEFRVVESIPVEKINETWVGSKRVPFLVKTLGMRDTTVTGLRLHAAEAVKAWEGGEEI